MRVVPQNKHRRAVKKRGLQTQKGRGREETTSPPKSFFRKKRGVVIIMVQRGSGKGCGSGHREDPLQALSKEKTSPQRR